MSDQAVPAGEPVTSPFPAAYGPLAPPAAGEQSTGRSRVAPRRERHHDEPTAAAQAEPAPTLAAPPVAPRPSRDRGGAATVDPTGRVPVVPASPRPARPGTRAAAPVRTRGVPSRRLVRRIDTWTVFKVSLLFYLLMLVIVLLAGVVVWNVAVTLGFVGDIDKAVRSLADERSFVLHPVAVLEYSAAIGGILVVLGTILNTVAALLYNLISDVVGGVQVVVVE